MKQLLANALSCYDSQVAVKVSGHVTFARGKPAKANRLHWRTNGEFNH